LPLIPTYSNQGSMISTGIYGAIHIKGDVNTYKSYTKWGLPNGSHIKVKGDYSVQGQCYVAAGTIIENMKVPTATYDMIDTNYPFDVSHAASTIFDMDGVALLNQQDTQSYDVSLLKINSFGMHLGAFAARNTCATAYQIKALNLAGGMSNHISIIDSADINGFCQGIMMQQYHLTAGSICCGQCTHSGLFINQMPGAFVTSEIRDFQGFNNAMDIFNSNTGDPTKQYPLKIGTYLSENLNPATVMVTSAGKPMIFGTVCGAIQTGTVTLTRIFSDLADIKILSDCWYNMDSSTTFTARKIRNKGTSTGTGSEQTIAHGLDGTPSYVFPNANKASDATNIYPLMPNGQKFTWDAGI
jgi:hypothetical protein